MDYIKEYEERVGKIPMNELTIEDKKIIVKYNLSEAVSYFSSALSTIDLSKIVWTKLNGW